MSKHLFHLALLALLGPGMATAPAAPPLADEPVKGIVAAGALLTLQWDENLGPLACLTRITPYAPVSRVEVTKGANVPYLRFQAGHGAFWFLKLFGTFGVRWMANEALGRCELG